METVAHPALQNMGLLGVMDAFTKIFVRDRMVAGGYPQATLSMVTMLWEAYQDAILEKKLEPFLKDANWLPTLQEMERVTGLPRMAISAFLVGLREHSLEKSTLEYLDPRKGQAAQKSTAETVRKVIEAPARIFQVATKPLVETGGEISKVLTGPLRYVAIIAAAGAAVYIGYQVSIVLSAKRKATKRKG